MTDMYKKNKHLAVSETARSQPSSPRPKQVAQVGTKSLPSSPAHEWSASPVKNKPLYMMDRVGNRSNIKSSSVVKDSGLSLLVYKENKLEFKG